MPGAVAQLPREFSFNEDDGFRMNDWAGKISALSHTESWGDLPRSNGAPGPVTRPPLEQQGHWDDDGDSEEKPETQGFGQDQGRSPANA